MLNGSNCALGVRCSPSTLVTFSAGHVLARTTGTSTVLTKKTTLARAIRRSTTKQGISRLANLVRTHLIMLGRRVFRRVRTTQRQKRDTSTTQVSLLISTCNRSHTILLTSGRHCLRDRLTVTNGGMLLQSIHTRFKSRIL